MIYVLYGQPGSGKTTLSKKLCDRIRFDPMGCEPVVLDGDEFRELFKQTDYSKNGRENNIRAANTVATFVSKVNQVDVIMALVNPYAHLRKELKANNSQVCQVYLHTDRDLRKEYHVENFEIGDPDIKINTDKNINASWIDLVSELNNFI